MSMKHFLLVYDRKAEILIDQQVFDDSAKALSAYEEKEREFMGNKDLEIVLIGADSIETVRQTHANYFEQVGTPSHYLSRA